MSKTMRERAYLHDGKVYLFRDVLRDDRFVAVEYGTQQEMDGVYWHPCAQGAEFSEVEPLFDLGAQEAGHRMTTEPTTLSPDVLEAVIRAARETAREEVRAAFDARKPGVVDARTALQRSQGYEVPAMMHGQPV